MCCFAQEVQDVSSTKIFARLTDKNKQVLAYSMKYQSDVANAMILPLPTTGREDSLSFIDLSEYKSFFNDLQRGFPKKKPLFSNALPTAARGAAVDSKLAIHKVGDFVASFVPSVDDFDRLDPQFVIPKETWAKVDGYEGFGFAVFQLDKDATGTHPMAMEFETTLDEQVFFPTLHIHDGEVHARERFDHYLFMQHAGYDSVVGAYDGPKHEDPKTGMVRSKQPAGKFIRAAKTKGLIHEDLLLHRKRMHGVLENRDELQAAKGHPTEVTLNWSPAKQLWPIAVGATGLAWIIGRRSKLGGKLQGSSGAGKQFKE